MRRFQVYSFFINNVFWSKAAILNLAWAEAFLRFLQLSARGSVRVILVPKGFYKEKNFQGYYKGSIRGL